MPSNSFLHIQSCAQQRAVPSISDYQPISILFSSVRNLTKENTPRQRFEFIFPSHVSKDSSLLPIPIHCCFLSIVHRKASLFILYLYYPSQSAIPKTVLSCMFIDHVFVTVY